MENTNQDFWLDFWDFDFLRWIFTGFFLWVGAMFGGFFGRFEIVFDIVLEFVSKGF